MKRCKHCWHGLSYSSDDELYLDTCDIKGCKASERWWSRYTEHCCKCLKGKNG